MQDIRVESVLYPLTVSEILDPLGETLRKAEAMGLLGGHGVVRELDLQGYRVLMQPVAEAGIGAAVLGELGTVAPTDTQRIRTLLTRLSGALEDSPVPQSELARLEPVLGRELLAQLVGISASSVRRYRSGVRPVPDDIADRVHYLALVVGDLLGAYNDAGVRRWFGRPRTQLEGQAPAELLGAGWSPDGDGPRRIRALARSLRGSPAT